MTLEIVAGSAVILFASGAVIRFAQLRGLGLPADLGVAWSTSSAVSVTGAVVAIAGLVFFVAGAVAMVASVRGIERWQKKREQGGHQPTDRDPGFRFAILAIAFVAVLVLGALAAPGTGRRVGLALSIALAIVAVGIGFQVQAKKDDAGFAVNSVVLIAGTGALTALALFAGYRYDKAPALPYVSYSTAKECHVGRFVGEVGDDWVFARGKEKPYLLFSSKKDTEVHTIGSTELGKSRCPYRDQN